MSQETVSGPLTSLRSRLVRFDPYDLAAGLLLATLLAIALLVFRDYAISNDEEVQHRYGELIIAYYASGFADQSMLDFKNLYLYGGLFDVVSILLGRILPVDVFVIRHVLCAMFGIGGVAAVWATARLIAGPRAAFLAALALAVCGPWFGTMFNHTKDIPFAASMMGATYLLLRAARDLPQPRWRHVLGFGVLLGMALGLRALGLLVLLYVLIAIALRIPQPFAWNQASRFVAQSLLRFVPGLALAYAIMIAAWPWAALDLFNPVRALFAFAHFHYPIKTLFFGDLYMMADVPRWYVPTYLAIKLPLLLLLGAALAVVFAGRHALQRRPSGRRERETLLVAFIALFPVLTEVAAHGPAFSGMRHFTFVVPPLAVLAGIGFDSLFGWLAARQRAVAAAAVVVLGAWLVWTTSVLVRLHPYEYLFFNPLVGGLAGAAQRYDTDYWVNVMHEAVIELENFIDREDPRSNRRRYYVAVCGERLPFEKEAAPRGRLVWATDDDPADFFLAPSHQGCDTALDGKVIIRIERMGVLIGVVRDRRHLLPDVARNP